jgi:hypothetical protein
VILIALFVSVAPTPLSLEPFRDEQKAADALDAQMTCIGGGVFARLNDKRPVATIAAEVVANCDRDSSALRNALADVYRRKPSLLPVGQNAEQAALTYVQDMNSRVEFVINEGRKKN